MRSVKNIARPEPAPIRRVIIADADADTRELYSECFRSEGWEILEASDGRDALVKTLMSPPSLLITEVHLPFIDGIALCEVLRQDPLTRSVPVLVVTTETRMAQAARARRAGVTNILHKPASLESILHEARRLSASDGSEGANLSNTSPPAAAVPQAGIRFRRGSKSHHRFETDKPPVAPPPLVCPSCDRLLEYRKSRIGGVSWRFSEQWDQYVCPGTCGRFEYRHRTRQLRATGE
jgi:two-component system chemotaxis response regulator CheY